MESNRVHSAHLLLLSSPLLTRRLESTSLLFFSSMSFLPPPSDRTYLDDIDEGEPAPSVTATATPPPPPPPSASVPSGLDDIDEDEPKQTNTKEEANKAAAEASVTEGAAEVARILAVLASDRELSASMALPNASAANATAPPISQPNHFSVLGLSQPSVTVTGIGLWSGSVDDVKSAFKRLVVLTHPDKNSAEGAKDAFEAVKAANSILANDAERYDYVKAYTTFRRIVDQRSANFVPPSAVSASLADTLSAGRQVQAAKKKQSDSFAARLQAQAEQKRQAVMAGDAARRKEDEQRRQEELKRKVMESESESSDDENELSVAEKIRQAKASKGKKIRLL